VKHDRFESTPKLRGRVDKGEVDLTSRVGELADVADARTCVDHPNELAMLRLERVQRPIELHSRGEV
jgi:hypothetical protein